MNWKRGLTRIRSCVFTAVTRRENPSVRRQMFGRAEYGPRTQWDSNSLKEEGLPPATSGMNPEDTMLSEISQTQKDKCWATPFTQGRGRVRTEGRRWAPGPGGGEADSGWWWSCKTVKVLKGLKLHLEVDKMVKNNKNKKSNPSKQQCHTLIAGSRRSATPKVLQKGSSRSPPLHRADRTGGRWPWGL